MFISLKLERVPRTNWSLAQGRANAQVRISEVPDGNRSKSKGLWVASWRFRIFPRARARALPSRTRGYLVTLKAARVSIGFSRGRAFESRSPSTAGFLAVKHVQMGGVSERESLEPERLV